MAIGLAMWMSSVALTRAILLEQRGAKIRLVEEGPRNKLNETKRIQFSLTTL